MRAAMVATPEEYRWSSLHTHLGKACDPLISLHPAYLALGSGDTDRHDAYRRWLQTGISEEDIASIRRHLAQERVLGDERFQRLAQRH